MAADIALCLSHVYRAQAYVAVVSKASDNKQSLLNTG